MISRHTIDNSIAHPLCAAMSSVFVAAARERFDLCDFTKAFLPSDTFECFFHDHSIFSQSPYYVLELFSEEHPAPLKPQEYREEDIADWFGYLFAHWHIYRGISGTEIAQQYDIGKLWFAYEPLHTQDIDYAIDRIIEDLKVQDQQISDEPTLDDNFGER